VHLKLLFNPVAGRGRAKRHAGEVEQQLRALGADVDPYATRSPEDLTRAAAESSSAGYDRVVVCGGDGSVNLALRHFDLLRGTMAIIPLGSGDDFAQVNGISRESRAACEIAVRGSVREVDVAVANGLRYAGVAGLGFDSEVARYANEKVKWLRGSAIYLYAILRVLPRFAPRPVQIDGRQEEIMFAVFGNASQYGAGIRITPDAKLDDGLLDACIVHRISRLQLLMTLPLAYNGAHVRKSFVEIRRGREFQVLSEQPMDVYADGEPLTKTPVKFGIASEKLRIMVPNVENGGT
jgi:diacylglycerol kinase (ATP)